MPIFRRPTADPGTEAPDDVRIDPVTGEPEPFRRYALRSLGRAVGRVVFGRLKVLFAAPWLVFGGVFLAGAWEIGTGMVGGRADRETLTGRGRAVVEASWWRIDFDPAPLGTDGTNWRDLVRRELCSRFRFVSGGGGATAVACRAFRGLAHGSDLWAVDAPELPVRWVDAAGRPALDLRLSARSAAWLAAHPATWWPLIPQDDAMRARHRPGTALDALLVEADAPAELLLAAWDPAAAAPVAMAFDPASPERAVPLAALAAPPVPESAPLLAVFSVAGLLMWTAGCGLVTAGARRAVRAAVIAGSLLLLPWWGSHLHRALGLLWGPAGGLVSFLGPELTPGLARVAPRPAAEDEAAAGDVHRPLTLASSRYADVLAVAADLPLPPPAASPDEVLGAVSSAIAERVLALPAADLAAWVSACDEHARLAAHGADLLTVEALRRLSLDPARPRLAAEATYALSYVAHQLRTTPADRAHATRRRLLEALRHHPAPIVYNMARLE